MPSAETESPGIMRRRNLTEYFFGGDSTAAAAIGYKEVGTYLRGECTEEQAREAVKLATTRYSKRQLSWLRGRSYVKWAMICGDPEQDKKMLDKIVNISLILSERR